MIIATIFKVFILFNMQNLAFEGCEFLPHRGSKHGANSSRRTLRLDCDL